MAGPVNIRSGTASGVLPPKKTYTRPTWVEPGPYTGAPTITSSKPSPFTSPADATELPNQELEPVASPVNVRSGVESSDGAP